MRSATTADCPHMCRSGHAEVRYADPELAGCPACRVLDREAALYQTLYTAYEHLKRYSCGKHKKLVAFLQTKLRDALPSGKLLP